MISEQQLVNHLLFHKALVAEEGGNERINDYIRLVRESGGGAHVNIEDPFDRSIALAFELVLEQGMDPWHIDLVQFASLYMQRVKERPELDLITAGRILLMAWTILRMQSDRLRERAEPPPMPEPVEEDPWGAIDDAWAVDDPDRAYTSRVIEGEAIIDEKIRHKGDRKVTLMELVEALEEAKREADLRAEIVAKREAEKTLRRTTSRSRAENAAHKEDLEADIGEVWERIAGLNGAPIPITEIQERTRDDLVKTFVSILFLARQNRIRVWQENFPYGMIYVQNPSAASHEGHDPTAPASRSEAALENSQN